MTTEQPKNYAAARAMREGYKAQIAQATFDNVSHQELQREILNNGISEIHVFMQLELLKVIKQIRQSTMANQPKRIINLFRETLSDTCDQMDAPSRD